MTLTTTAMGGQTLPSFAVAAEAWQQRPAEAKTARWNSAGAASSSFSSSRPNFAPPPPQPSPSSQGAFSPTIYTVFMSMMNII
jgi:hypothetical protein